MTIYEADNVAEIIDFFVNFIHEKIIHKSKQQFSSTRRKIQKFGDSNHASFFIHADLRARQAKQELHEVLEEEETLSGGGGQQLGEAEQAS